MRQLRFYIPFELQPGGNYEIPEDKARHIAQVLRLSAGAEITLFNGDGTEYCAQLIEVKKKSVAVSILSGAAVDRESRLHVELIQGLSKGDRMDITIQKCVELGVNRIYPVSSSRSNLKLNIDRMEKKHQHWKGVIHSACEQSGRNVIPHLEESNHLDVVLNEYKSHSGLKLVLNPVAESALFQIVEEPQEVVLLVGPEGGFSDEELKLAQNCGFVCVSLGPRVLRTETAAMAAMAGIQARWGDL